MPDIKQFFATNNYRTEDSGFSAFETLGRRVSGQYDQAGNDIRDIGRANAATISMIGRWPFNILDLEKRESLRFAKQNAPGRGPAGTAAGAVQGRGGSGGSITDEQFAPRREVDLSSLNQISEGMSGIGNVASASSLSQATAYDRYGYRAPGSQYGNLTDLRTRREMEDAVSNAREEAAAKRASQLEDAAYQKRWSDYQKDLSGYNKYINDEAQKASPYGSYDTEGNATPGKWNEGGLSPDPYAPGEYGSPIPGYQSPSDYGGTVSSGGFGSAFSSGFSSGFSVDQSVNEGTF